MVSVVLCLSDALEALRTIPDKSVDLTFTSPPYPLKTQRYGEKKKMTWEEWSAWMSVVVKECCRVTTGFVLVNANNPIKNGRELPAVELLKLLCHDEGISLERPIIWHKNSAPNRRDWWVNTWEPVVGFYSGDRPKIWNWEAIAQPPKYTSGGAFRQRDQQGRRRAGGAYPTTKLARPRDVLYVTVGGGHLGWSRAHESEAPFPEKLVDPFVLALTNPGQIVLDPFSGSATTGAVALRHGRKYVGIDNRPCQQKLGYDRLRNFGHEIGWTMHGVSLMRD